MGRPIVFAVLLSPWILGYSDSHAAVANHIAFTMAFGPIALLIAVLRPAAYALLLGAVWLVLSPWILGYAGDHSAWLAELVGGLVLMLVSVSALRAMRPYRNRPGPPGHSRSVQEHPRAASGRCSRT